MELNLNRHRLVVVVGSGGVGKTTLAAALGLTSARRGNDTLVMTFDPSLRLKDTLGVGDEALDNEVRVETDTPGSVHASLLDARRTFDRLIEAHAPDETAGARILENRFYEHLSGNLSGILEYMAVERLFEVAERDRYATVVLDTPPTREALDFLEAPQRIVSFLDSGAVKLALRSWFDDQGHLRGASWLGFLGKRVEDFFDRIVGLGLLRDMTEFFQAFGPLYEGFRERAVEVEQLLRSESTLFVLVAGPGAERVADTLFFARRLREAGYNLGPIIVNRVHPRTELSKAGSRDDPAAAEARKLFHWLGERDYQGLTELGGLLGGESLRAIELLAQAPTALEHLERLGGAVVLTPVTSKSMK